jgi:fatty acid desaturase
MTAHFGLEARALTALLINISVLVALISIQKIHGNEYSYPIYVVLAASRLKVFAEFLHEAVHYNISRNNRVLNDRIGFLLGIPLLFSFKAYRTEHLLHHRRTGRKDDPTQVWFSHHDLHRPNKTLLKLFVYPLLGNQIPNYLRDICSDLREDVPFRVAATAYSMLLVILSISGHGVDILVLWILPLLWIYPVLNFWNELIDHYNAPEGTRNFQANPLITAIITPLASNYHALHHKRPDLPWFSLKSQFDGTQSVHGLFEVLTQFMRKDIQIDPDDNPRDLGKRL